MHVRHCLGAGFVVAVMSVSAFGQTPLEWRLKEGDQFFLQTVNSLKQTIKWNASTITEETTTLDKFKVVKRDATQLVLEKTIVSRKVKSSVNGPGDSAEAEKKLDERNAQIARKLEGAVCTITMDPGTRKVVTVRGIDEHVARAFGENPDLEKTIAADLSAKTVKADMESLFAALLPDRPVNPGDRWQRKTLISFGAMGEFRADGDYTYRGKSDLDGKSLDRIDVAWTLQYVAPDKESGLPYTIKKADLKTEKAQGTSFFDAAMGRLVQFQRTVHVKGTLEVVLGGDEVQIGIDAEQTGTVRWLDRDPQSK
jgi:hypothetical protein